MTRRTVGPARLALAAIPLVLAVVVPFSSARPQAQTTAVAFEGGRWFTGTAFESRTAYVDSGILSFRRPARIESSIDLAGGYVVPPFGEAHNHNVEGSGNIDRLISRYLEHGIFYVKNPNNLPRDREALAGKIKLPTSIDVTFANGGWTGVDGHPMEIAKRNLDRRVWSDRDGEGGFYWSAATSDDIARKWPVFLAQRPQFVKGYLLFSEEYAKRQNDAASFGWKGLDPRVLPDLARRAHEAGLRLSVHIETAADFHNALVAGADEVNHLAGFRGNMERPMTDPTRFEISDADAQLAARNQTVVVTTLSGATQVALDGPQREFRLQLESLYRRNLHTLRRHQVRLAIGSDAYDTDALAEAMFLNGLAVFEPAELLRTWTQGTVQAIFPDRHVGVLEEGAEASFLVLRGNPLEDFNAVLQIARRVKQGRNIPAPF